MARDYPGRKKFEKYSQKVRELGLPEENIGHGPRESDLMELLQYEGLGVDFAVKR